MFVRGVDVNGNEFLDLGKTLNISAVGACVALSRPVRVNEIISLTVPAPPPVTSGVIPPSTPPIQARVRRQQSAGSLQLLGAEFLKPLD